jgi:hypothetical protein
MRQYVTYDTPEINWIAAAPNYLFNAQPNTFLGLGNLVAENELARANAKNAEEIVEARELGNALRRKRQEADEKLETKENESFNDFVNRAIQGRVAAKDPEGAMELKRMLLSTEPRPIKREPKYLRTDVPYIRIDPVTGETTPMPYTPKPKTDGKQKPIRYMYPDGTIQMVQGTKEEIEALGKGAVPWSVSLYDRRQEILDRAPVQGPEPAKGFEAISQWLQRVVSPGVKMLQIPKDVAANPPKRFTVRRKPE